MKEWACRFALTLNQKNYRIQKRIYFSSCLLALAGCNQESTIIVQPAAEPITQGELCEVYELSANAAATACKPGQKVVFLPNSWGNAQLPVIFAAISCNHRYSIALTEGAVSCVYLPLNSPELEAEGD